MAGIDRLKSTLGASETTQKDKPLQQVVSGLIDANRTLMTQNEKLQADLVKLKKDNSLV